MKKDYLNQNDKKVVLKERNSMIQVDIKNITLIVCEGYLSTLYFLNDQKPIKVSKLLKDFELELVPFGFFRINRNTIVNLQNVYSFHGSCNRLVTMVDNQKVYVSFRKISQFKKLFE
jgi:DNA-binding LytR/AlgR family response regulator